MAPSFPVEVSARTITVDGATYTQAIIRDISERRQAEQALRESQERLAATLRSIGDAVIGTDAQGRVTLLNQVAESLTGWPADEALGRPLGEVFRIISADTRQPAENPVERVLRQGAIVRLANHTVLISREGAEYQIADSGAPIRGGDGVIIGAVLVFRDVTAEYRSQQELREQEARFRAVFDNSVDALRVAKDGRLVMANPAYLRLFGYEREEELIGLPLWDLVAPEDRQRIQEIVERRARGNEAPGVYEAHCLRRDGSTFLAEVHAGGYQVAGEYYSHAVVRDVTKQRAEEQAVREAKRLLGADPGQHSGCRPGGGPCRPHVHCLQPVGGDCLRLPARRDHRPRDRDPARQSRVATGVHRATGGANRPRRCGAL